jgi:ribosomal protein S20
MRELLEKLKNAPSAEAKRELLAELAKAQRRLRDLAQSLARLSQRVPSEFINREAIPQGDAKNAMEELQAAIEAGDMEAAERQLEALSQQIDQLAQHVDQGGSRFREARFGEHDRAVQKARNQLSMLAAEQERLAGRSREVVQDAARRAQARGEQAQDSSGMQQLAQGAQGDLDTLGEANSNTSDGQLLGQARERTRDVSDALRTGDLAEARRMSAAAQRSLDSLARSLDHDAQMFPGHNGETRARAQAAADAAAKLRRLSEQLDQAMPPLDNFMGDEERARLRGDAPQQRSAREQAEKLSAQMGQENEGAPVSPDAQRGLQEVGEAMRRAEQALSEGDADEASRSQEEAADRLRQIEQGMAQKGQRQRGEEGPREGERGGEGREGQDGRGRNSDAPVRIPGAEEFTGPVEMRRKVLDAMREQGPSGFESALQRYYEGLLR